MKYTEVKFVLKNDDVVIETTQERLIANGSMQIKQINFQQEKENIKASLLDVKEKTCKTSTTGTRGSKYRRRG